MGTISENSLWYKGKSEVFREFKKSTAAILSAVASRNFSAMPGFAVEAFTDIEIDSKIKLTEYNQKIMGEAIDRELKALGLENDISLKQATMAWELEKMQLFADLQTEFADKELLRSLRGEEIDGLMIDQEFREIVVLLSKVAIEVEIEGIKRQKEEVELLPLPLEEQLAAAKLAAATRKLAVIPYIMAALAAQSAALDEEETVIMPARQEKANYEKEVAYRTTAEVLPAMELKAATTGANSAAQAELLAPTIEKANKTMALADRMADLLPPMTEKAVATTELTTRQRELIQPMLDKAEATVALITELKTLIDPMTRKADKLDEFTLEQATLLQPMTDKANKTQELTTALNTLLDPMSRKATESELLTAELLTLLEPLTLKALASRELADEMMAQLVNHIALAQEKVTMSEKKVARLTEELKLMGKEITLEGKKITIERDRAGLELQRATSRLAVATALQTQLALIKTAMEDESKEEITYINKTGANEVAVRKDHLDKVDAARYAAERADLAGQVSEVNRLAIALTEHNDIMIKNTKTVRLTEKLIHLLA